jgi:hypothetical protein
MPPRELEAEDHLRTARVLGRVVNRRRWRRRSLDVEEPEGVGDQAATRPPTVTTESDAANIASASRTRLGRDDLRILTGPPLRTG